MTAAAVDQSLYLHDISKTTPTGSAEVRLNKARGNI